jgi:hypothetical protein
LIKTEFLWRRSIKTRLPLLVGIICC